MILKFKIKNHLSIKDVVVLDFVATKKGKHFDFFCEEIGKYKVLKIAMLFGPNASGKSNILHSLDRFRNIVLDDNLSKDDPIQQIPFEFDAVSKETPTVFEIEMLIDSIKYSYKIEFNDKFILNEILRIYDPNKVKYFSRITETGTGKVILHPGSKFSIDEVDIRTITGNTLPNMTILSGYNKTSLQLDILTKVREWFHKYLRPIIEPKTRLKKYVTNRIHKQEIKKQNVLNMLKEADFNIDEAYINEIKVTKEMVEKIKEIDTVLYNKLRKKFETKEELISLDLYFKHLVKDNNKETTYKLENNLESLGTLRYYGLSGILSQTVDRGGILNIDELESSLHPDLLNHYINTFMLNTKRSQLIFTSHYHPLLEETDELRKDIVWFTEKREDGSTDLYSLKDINIRSSLNYYKAYKTGKFGAKPFIGSAFIQEDNVDDD
ncbi:MAG: ATP-binding protein [Candidatus Cloacimonadota bacterium]|nr:ATP-binding protein [Candidatus Cloacimonadota bacterium]